MDAWLVKHFGGECLDKLAFGYFTGKFKQDPLKDHIPELRSQVWAFLESNGIYGPAGEVRRSPDQIDFGFILSMAKLLGDPDWESLIPYGTTRVRLGVDIEMPRTPAVWPPKKRWPLAPI